MVTLSVPLSTSQIVDLVRQLPVADRRKLLDVLLSERFEAVLSECDEKRGEQPALSDDEIQAEIDAVRQARYQERRRAAGG